MRNGCLALALAVGLASCGENSDPEAQRLADEADIAAVEALQDAPALPIDPQPILYPDIERHKLYGASCAFVPQGSGLGAIVLAMADVGYMKFDGAIQRFAPDPGSDEQPLGTRVQYDGRSHSFSLTLDADDPVGSGYETSDYRATFIVSDASGRTVYEAAGFAQCGV